jgi:DNA gyrase subunit A
MSKFNFSQIQAEAILEMKLNKLAGLERKKLEDELSEKLLIIADLKDILAKAERIVSIISEELSEVKDKFGDDRRTQVNTGKI